MSGSSKSGAVLLPARGRELSTRHLVVVYRDPSELDEACEVAVCGALARLSVEENGPAQLDAPCQLCADSEMQFLRLQEA